MRPPAAPPAAPLLPSSPALPALPVALLLMALALPLAAPLAHAAPGMPSVAVRPESAPLTLRLTDEAITKAVRETLAENPDPSPARETGALRADRYEQFRQRVDDAVVPGCLRPDAMKFQPARIGPIGVGGVYALPFWALAAIRGKCR